MNHSEIDGFIKCISDFNGKSGIKSYLTKYNINLIYPDILENYKNELKKAQNDNDKIGSIVDFMQIIEWFHMFNDGNCRMIYILLNKELVKNGLSPCILDDPNDFDYKTRKELIEEVEKGQKAFANLVENGKPYDDSIDQQAIENNIGKINENISLENSLHLNAKNLSEIAEYANWAVLFSTNYNDGMALISLLSKLKTMFVLKTQHDIKENYYENMCRLTIAARHVEIFAVESYFNLQQDQKQNFEKCLKLFTRKTMKSSGMEEKNYLFKLQKLCSLLKNTPLSVNDLKNPLTCHEKLDSILIESGVIFQDEVSFESISELPFSSDLDTLQIVQLNGDSKSDFNEQNNEQN
mgnify:CR=1 FL=1